MRNVPPQGGTVDPLNPRNIATFHGLRFPQGNGIYQFAVVPAGAPAGPMDRAHIAFVQDDVPVLALVRMCGYAHTFA